MLVKKKRKGKKSCANKRVYMGVDGKGEKLGKGSNERRGTCLRKYFPVFPSESAFYSFYFGTKTDQDAMFTDLKWRYKFYLRDSPL